MFYALYAPYGIRAAYGPNHAPAVHTFDTKAERDAWVSDDPELKKESCTWAEAKRWMRDYQIQDNFDARKGVISKSYKLDAQLVQRFADTCDKQGTSQAATLTMLMQGYINDHP